MALSINYIEPAMSREEVDTISDQLLELLCVDKRGVGGS